MTIAIVQIILSVVIITLILLQERSSGMSGLLGGSGEGYYQARRGMEKLIF
jgi:protein translocase SecG subunit